MVLPPPPVIQSGVQAENPCPQVEETCQEVRTAAGRSPCAGSAGNPSPSGALTRSTVPGNARTGRILAQEAESLRPAWSREYARPAERSFSLTGLIRWPAREGTGSSYRKSGNGLTNSGAHRSSGSARTSGVAQRPLRSSVSGRITGAGCLPGEAGHQSCTRMRWQNRLACARFAAARRNLRESGQRASCTLTMTTQHGSGGTCCAAAVIKDLAASGMIPSGFGRRQLTLSGTGRQV